MLLLQYSPSGTDDEFLSMNLFGYILKTESALFLSSQSCIANWSVLQLHFNFSCKL